MHFETHINTTAHSQLISLNILLLGVLASKDILFIRNEISFDRNHRPILFLRILGEKYVAEKEKKEQQIITQIVDTSFR